MKERFSINKCLFSIRQKTPAKSGFKLLRKRGKRRAIRHTSKWWIKLVIEVAAG
jgi:hypothetical protein